MLSDLDSIFNDYSFEKIVNLSKHISENIDCFQTSWHPLGFVIIKILETQQYNYRMHIWPSNKRIPKKPNWPIHNHIFDLESLVLKGKIGSEKIEVSSSSLCKNIYELYAVEYNKFGSDIVDTGTKVKIKSHGVSWTKKGQTYTVKKGVFHQSCVHPNKFAASLVRTSNQFREEAPLVVGRTGMENRYQCNALPIETKELKQLLRQLEC